MKYDIIVSWHGPGGSGAETIVVETDDQIVLNERVDRLCEMAEVGRNRSLAEGITVTVNPHVEQKVVSEREGLEKLALYAGLGGGHEMPEGIW